jgi:hypothetical protein
MKKFLQSHHRASNGAALIIVLAFVVLVTALALAHFSRTTTDRQLAQSSYNDTSADLLARSALDITVSDLKQEITNNPTVTTANIQPQRYGDDVSIPNLIRRSFQGDPTNRTSSVNSTAASANGRTISLARWNSHYLIPPTATFSAPDWVLVTPQGPNSAPPPNAVIGRYAFAVYDEGGLLDMNLGGFPKYAGLTLPTRPTRRMAAKYPLEESEIILAAFTPNAPCHVPKFTPNTTNASGGTGAPLSPPITFNTNGTDPQTFTASFLPHGLSMDPSTGTISGIPTSPGTFTITLGVTNECGSDTGTLVLRIDGRIGPDSTPWPVNRARKGSFAFADLTTLPSTPTDTQINKLMGWRNYATTQQPNVVSFDNPSFPLPAPDNYAKYFLGAFPPPDYVFTTPFTTVRNDIPPVNGRTDQAVMTRQELIKLQRTIGFSPSLLQYLGTFSRDTNRPAPDWSQTLAARWDMNNLQGMIPDSWLAPGHHGIGHAFGKQRHSFIGQLFGLVWVSGNFTPGTRLTDPNYYGHWKYFHNLNQWSANPDFFQIIDYAMNRANGGVVDPNHVRNTFNVGAALIDQYDTDDLYDPDPNPPSTGDAGNTITIIDYGGTSYAYGIEGMSFDDPNLNLARPGPYCQYPPPVPANYVLLNRRFENVGEFGYAYNPASTTPSKTLDFASATSKDKPILDFFTYNIGTKRAGIVNLNTRNSPVLASIISGALLHDLGSENEPTALVSPAVALNAGQAIVQETTNASAGRGPALTRADVARLAAAAAAQLPVVPGVPVDEVNQTIARTLAEVGQARTWNLMIDVIAQTGTYAPGTPNLTDPTKFIVQGEKRYWLHIALDRDSGTVLGTQLEEVTE